MVVISPLTFGSEKKYEFTAVFTRQEVGQLNVRGYKSEKKELTAPDGSSYILQAENRNDYLTFTVTPGKPPKQPETTEHGGKKPDVYYFKGDRALYPTLKLKDPIKVGNVEITEIQIASFQRTPVTYKGQKVLSTEEKARVDLLYLSEKGLLTDPLGKLQKFGLWINKGFLQFLWLGIDLSKMQHISSTNTTPPVHTFEATIVGERGDHDPWKISLIVAPGKVGNEMRVELIEVPEAFFDPKEIKKEALLGDLDRDTPFAHIDYPTWMSELSDKL